MNIVDVIKGQLGDEVLGKLSSLIGEGEDKTRAAVDAAIPALLSSLAGLASTSGGADKLINALKQVDQGSQGGGLGDVLANRGQAGAWLEKGGSLLSILLGSAALPTIISVLGKFAGLAGPAVKSLLGYLAPLILAQIAKQVSARGLTSAVALRLLRRAEVEHRRCRPGGFLAGRHPGLRDVDRSPSGRLRPRRPEGSGLPSWLLPLVGLGLLAGLAYWFVAAPAEQPAPAPVAGTPPPANRGPLPESKGESAAFKKAPPIITETAPVAKEAMAALPDATKLGTDLGSVFTSATQYLTGVKDAATAETAVPKLKDLVTQLEGYKGLWDKLPDVGKASVAKVVTDHIGPLKELVNKVLAIAGVGDKLKPILETLIAKLSEYKV